MASAQRQATEMMKLDLYGILDVPPNATDKEIVKAYRKKALKCHPDKNPDNPKAAELFHQLSKALEILTDVEAKEAYDKVLRARKASELRDRELDAKRKKLKQDLESREQSAFQKQASEASAAKTLEEQIKRLRKEGSRLLKEEQERLREELKQQQLEKETNGDEQKAAPRLKVKWKKLKDDSIILEYTQDSLHRIFSKYGEVAALIVSSKNKGSAIVEFSSAHAALQAVQFEIGNPSNPLALSWLSGQPAEPTRQNTVPPVPSQPTFPVFSSSNQQHVQSVHLTTSSNRDYEDLVLMRMRQAQERKRLIEKLQEEEDGTSGITSSKDRPSESRSEEKTKDKAEETI